MYFTKLSQVDQYISEGLQGEASPEVTECLK